MRPERIVLGVATAPFVAGVAVWVLGGATAFRSFSLWLWLGGLWLGGLWLGAFGVLCLPLALWLADVVWRALRR